MNRIPFCAALIIASLAVSSPESRAAGAKSLLSLDGEINDALIQSTLTKQAEMLVQSGGATKNDALAAELNRKTCSLKLPKAGKQILTAAEQVAKYRAGVVIVAQPYKCTKCEKTHSQLASGFMLTEDGAFCTSYHVMSNLTIVQTMIIMTGDGRVVPVREVLAANPEADLVILRAEGSGFTPLPLGTNAAVGSTIRVISHPNNHFYSLTEGIASRYFSMTRNRKSVSMLAITADFAKGSSGAPVLNEYGAVVGSVNSTLSSYYTANSDGHQDNLQMVFKNCVSSRHVLEMIKPE